MHNFCVRTRRSTNFSTSAAPARRLLPASSAARRCGCSCGPTRAGVRQSSFGRGAAARWRPPSPIDLTIQRDVPPIALTSVEMPICSGSQVNAPGASMTFARRLIGQRARVDRDSRSRARRRFFRRVRAFQRTAGRAERKILRRLAGDRGLRLDPQRRRGGLRIRDQQQRRHHYKRPSSSRSNRRSRA